MTECVVNCNNNKKNDDFAWWWEGIRLWYNDGAYREAMDLWQAGLLSRQQQQQYCNNDKDSSSSATYDIDALEEHWDTFLQSKDKGSDDLSVARLWLFLAGCYLDAREIRQARHCLWSCLELCFRCCRCSDKNNSGSAAASSTIATEALQEYMASYVEDEDCTKDNNALAVAQPWLVGRRVVELALKSDQFITKWNNPFQRAAYIYPMKGMDGSYPFYNRHQHPTWCCKLEENWETIHDEFRMLLRRRNHDDNKANNQTPTHWPAVGAGDHRGGAGQHDGSVVEEGGDWREIVLFGTGARPELAPRTCQLIDKYCRNEVVSLAQEGAGEVILSVLAPGTHILPHTASHNLRLTAHLGLQVPKDSYDNNNGACYLRVADADNRWETGKMLVFDDSYEHEVVNDTSEIRAVLLLRFWHPAIPVQERASALQAVMTAKQDDGIKRCNPPVPMYAGDGRGATARGMERSQCPACSRTGFESMRLVSIGNFACLCGQDISGN